MFAWKFCFVLRQCIVQQLILETFEEKLSCENTSIAYSSLNEINFIFYRATVAPLHHKLNCKWLRAIKCDEHLGLKQAALALLMMRLFGSVHLCTGFLFSEGRSQFSFLARRRVGMKNLSRLGEVSPT